MVSLGFLLNIPLIPELADFVWGSDNDEKFSAEFCINDVLNADCFVRLLVKVLGIAMITGAFLNKAPVIINILNSQSAAGLSKNSVYGEIIIYAICFLYGYREELPFTAYGENFALLLQTIGILALTWKFSKTPLSEMIAFGIIFVVFMYAGMTMLSKDYVGKLFNSLLPMSIYSKGSQIYTIYSEKHTGNQSIITLAMNVTGVSIRVLTTLAEAGDDMNLLVNYIVSAMLNGTLFVQYLYYQENTKKFWKEETQKKKS